jgi:hypothetical protein
VPLSSTFQERASESRLSLRWTKDRWSTYSPMGVDYLPYIVASYGFAQKGVIGRVKQGLRSYLA